MILAVAIALGGVAEEELCKDLAPLLAVRFRVQPFELRKHVVCRGCTIVDRWERPPDSPRNVVPGLLAVFQKGGQARPAYRLFRQPSEQRRLQGEAVPPFLLLGDSRFNLCQVCFARLQLGEEAVEVLQEGVVAGEPFVLGRVLVSAPQCLDHFGVCVLVARTVSVLTGFRFVCLRPCLPNRLDRVACLLLACAVGLELDPGLRHFRKRGEATAMSRNGSFAVAFEWREGDELVRGGCESRLQISILEEVKVGSFEDGRQGPHE